MEFLCGNKYLVVHVPLLNPFHLLLLKKLSKDTLLNKKKLCRFKKINWQKSIMISGYKGGVARTSVTRYVNELEKCATRS